MYKAIYKLRYALLRNYKLFRQDSMSEEKLSKVKRFILKLLWGGRWVSSAKLLKETQQKYFDRRIRELRDELGYDIEMGFQKGEPHYRLKSKKRKLAKVRTYLGSKQKKELLENLPSLCALCGIKFTQKKQPVFDHRIPLIRGGPGSVANYQLLCHECNNQKRSQCRGCALNCKKCYLAFPEKYPPAIMVRITSKPLLEKINLHAKKQKLSIEEYIIELLKNEREN